MANYVAIGALVISTFSLIFTAFFAFNKLFSQKLSDNVARLDVRDRYYIEVVEWANSVIEIVQETTHFMLINISEDNSQEILERRELLRTRCSIVLDKGRWIFPNVEEIENNKFSGYGKDILNCVAWIYKFISSIDTDNQDNNWELRDNILETKREFVNQIRKVINPKTRVYEYERIFGNYHPHNK